MLPIELTFSLDSLFARAPFAVILVREEFCFMEGLLAPRPPSQGFLSGRDSRRFVFLCTGEPSEQICVVWQF